MNNKKWIDFSESCPQVGQLVEVLFIDGSDDKIKWHSNWNPEYEDIPKMWRPCKFKVSIDKTKLNNQ